MGQSNEVKEQRGNGGEREAKYKSKELSQREIKVWQRSITKLGKTYYGGWMGGGGDEGLKLV